jgi:hypothetical protein
VSSAGLNTVSLRQRVTTAVIGVLAVTLVLTGVAVNAVFVASSNRRPGGAADQRIQLARQLARAGVGAQQIVNRAETDGVRAYLVLRNGTPSARRRRPVPASRGRTVTAERTGAGEWAQLTLTVDTALVSGARQRLRRILILVSLGALVASALLVAGAVRLALRPLSSMAALARTVTEGNRGRRLAPTRTDTEIGQTAAGARRDAGRAGGGGEPGAAGRGADPGVPGRRRARAADADHRGTSGGGDAACTTGTPCRRPTGSTCRPCWSVRPSGRAP